MWTAHARYLGCGLPVRIWCLMIWGGAEAVMLALGSGCKYRLSLAERFDCTETIINQLLADSYQNPISEWQMKTSSGLPLILHYGELYNYFIIYYNVIIIEMKCTINVTHLNHPLTPSMENCLPQNWSLVPKSLGTAAIECPTCLIYLIVSSRCNLTCPLSVCDTDKTLDLESWLSDIVYFILHDIKKLLIPGWLTISRCWVWSFG